MGAAADFKGVLAHFIGADGFAVLAFEQADGALVLGFLHGHLFADDRYVRIDGHVHQAFDLLDLFGGHLAAEAEVEAQALRCDVGTLLGHFIAQDLAQRGLEQVGGGMEAGRDLILLGQAALEGAFLLTDRLVLFERFSKAIGVHGQAFFSRQFLGQLQRETVGIIEAEGLLAADFGFGLVGRILLGHELILAADAGDALVEFLHAGDQRRFKAGGFLHDFIQDIVFLFHEERIGFVVDLLDEDAAHIREDGGLEAQLPGVADGAAEQAAQDVAGADVGRQDAVDVADQHGGGPDMIRDDPHRLLRFSVFIIVEAGLSLQQFDHGEEQVGLVAVGQAVQEGQHPVEAETGVHVLVCQGSVAVGVLDILHIDVVADFDIASAAACRAAVRTAGLVMTGIEPFVVRAAGRTGSAFQLPPVVGLGQVEDMLRQDADLFQQAGGLVVPGSSVVALEHGGADLPAVQAENLGQEVIAPAGLFLFEIIAQGPVAHHLEEGEVGRVADAFDIHRADAALHVAQALLSGRMILAQQVGHQRLHAGHVEHDAGASVTDQRYSSDIDVSPFLVEADPGISQFLGRDHWTVLSLTLDRIKI